MLKDTLHNSLRSEVVRIGVRHKASFCSQKLGYWQKIRRALHC